MSNRRLACLAVVVCLALPGCGDDESSSGTTSTTAAPTTTTTAALPPAGSLESSLLVVGDIPPGWTEQDVVPEDLLAAAAQDEINACLGLPKQSEAVTEEVDGKNFVKGYSSISSSVARMRSKELVDKDFAATRVPANLECVGAVLNREYVRTLGEGATATTKITPLPTVVTNSDQLALRVSTEFAAMGRTLIYYADLLVVRNGDIEVSINHTSLGAQPSTELSALLLDIVTNRLTGKIAA
jgi:hypothetical protein